MMHTDGPLLQIADATPESNLPRERKSPKFETASILFFTKRKSALFCKTENPPPPFFPNRCCYLSAITQGPLYLLYYNASVSLYGPGGGGLFGAAGAATAAAVQKKKISRHRLIIAVLGRRCRYPIPAIFGSRRLRA